MGEGSCDVEGWEGDATGELLEEYHGCSACGGGARIGCRAVVRVESSGSHDVTAVKRSIQWMPFP